MAEDPRVECRRSKVESRRSRDHPSRGSRANEEGGHFAPSFPIIFSIGLAVFENPAGTAKAATGTAALRTFFTIDVLVEVISLPARFTLVVVICFIGNPLM